MLRRVFGIFGMAALFGAAVCFGQAPVDNGGFEEGEPGDVPWRWFVPPGPAAAGSKAEIADAGCVKGKCATVTDVRGPGARFGNLMQMQSAEGYQGRMVKLKARIRVTGDETRAQMWLRLDRAGNGGVISLDNMSDRPVTSSEWGTYEIQAAVLPETAQFAYGLMVYGPGLGWIDEVSLEAGPEFSFGKPRELTERELRNLVAFTKLYGYVRFFHPSDQVVKADWTAMATAGVKAVLTAADDAELQARLETVFGPLAPTMRLWRRGMTKPAVAPELVGPAPAGGSVVRWDHLGVGLKESTLAGARGVYRSLRMPGALPVTPFSADLVEGLSAVVPVALWKDAGGTLPHGTAVAAAAAMPVIPGDRDARLADVVVAWNVFQHFYPYFDVVGTDWAAELPRALRGAAADPDAVAYEKTLRRMVAALKDGHGNVSGVVMGSASQVPPLGWAWVDGQMIVTKKDEGVEVALGDRILKLDGRPVEEGRAAWSPLVSAATRQFLEFRLFYDMGRCGGAVMMLEVEPLAKPGGRRSVEVKCRARLAGEKYVTETKPDAVKEMEPGIFYLDLDKITMEQWRAVEGKLVDAKGMVFDLRGYPNEVAMEVLGHLTEETVRSGQFRVPRVPSPDRVGMTFQDGGWPLKPRAPFFKGKKVFLTDGRAISYAETVMGIVEHFKLATIVGGATAGTNGNINPFRLPSGAVLSWTGMQVLKQDGARHHGVGILPAVEVKRSRAGIGAGRDEILEAGLAAVR